MHALREIHKVLHSNGVLIDLRPVEDRWPVEVMAMCGCIQTGRLVDHPTALEDDAASERAIAEAAANGLFINEKQNFFPLYYYWDTPNEMKDYIEKEWEDFNGLEEQTLRETQSSWASAGAEARPRVRLKMSIARWKKRSSTERG